MPAGKQKTNPLVEKQVFKKEEYNFSYIDTKVAQSF